MRTVRLFKDWRKQGEPEIATWHCFGQVGDEKEGVYLAAIVEMPNGNVEEVLADRLQFIGPPNPSLQPTPNSDVDF